LNPATNDYICGNSMHPLDDVTRGEKLVKRVYETIRNSPHWEKSVLIITFDEHGGFYDHVKPPKAIPPNDLILFSEDPRKFKFDQLGPRVPALVISPWIKKGTIDSVEYDHTSVLATLRKLFGLSHLTARDKNANDLLHLFSLTEPRKDTPQILPSAIENNEKIACLREHPPVEKLLALQANLMTAKKEGYYNKKKVADYELSDSDIGFAHIGLIRVMQKLPYKEKLVWLNEFRNIKTGLDAVKFRNEVELKLLHSIDINAIQPITSTPLANDAKVSV
jgi:phospholipase C